MITETKPAVIKKIWGLHPNVFFLGLTSFLQDVSSEMMFTLVPLFLANVLGAQAAIIGLVGGLSDSTEGIIKIFSGWYSDRIHRPKYLTVLGYGLSTLAKPFMYLATNWGVVTGVRLTDRVGKGIRTSPRDALLADSISSGERGRAFALREAMDTAGAVLGLSLAAVIIYHVQGGGLEIGLKTYRWLVLGSLIPALLAIAVLVVFVKESEKRKAAAKIVSGAGVSAPVVKEKFDKRFKIFLVILAIFTLGNSSDFFLILRAQNLHVPLVQVVMMLVAFNVIYAATSLPMGILSDKLGRKRIIIFGWSVYALIYLGFALSSNVWQTWLLFAGYGLYYGAFEGVGKAFVVDLVPPERMGTAFGLYNGVVSFALLPASVIAGWLWDTFNPNVPFYVGAGLAFIAMLGILFLVKEKPKLAHPI